MTGSVLAKTAKIKHALHATQPEEQKTSSELLVPSWDSVTSFASALPRSKISRFRRTYKKNKKQKAV